MQIFTIFLWKVLWELWFNIYYILKEAKCFKDLGNQSYIDSWPTLLN